MKERKSMQEIHEIMEKLYNKRKKMKRKDVIEDFHAGTQECKKRYGLKIEKVSSKVTVKK